MVSRRRLAWAIGIAAFLAFQAWLLAGRRLGEVAFRPPASVVVPSLEIAGPADLTQTFVPGADGLASVTFTPVGAVAGADVELQLDADERTHPWSPLVWGVAARARVPASALVPGAPFTWVVPRVDRAAGRQFRLRIASPSAPEGRGLRVAVGPPDYRWGQLHVGGRAQWGDLVFETRATRVHVVDTLRQLRRDAPWPLRSDGALIAGLLLLDAALLVVARYLAAGGRG